MNSERQEPEEDTRMRITSWVLHTIALIGVFASYLPLFYWRSYVATTLWRWFALPLWPALPEITAVQGIGLILLAKVVQGRGQMDLTHEPTGKEIASIYVVGVAFPAITLMFAAVVKFWMM